MLDTYRGSSHTSLMYKPHFQLDKLHKIDKPTIVETSLILGGAGFSYLAIPNPLHKTALHSKKSY